MMIAVSALKGFAVHASDGSIGEVADLLFDDRTWKIRWVVVETGSWWTGRKVLIHPSAIGAIDFGQGTLPVNLTQSDVRSSPALQQDAPVSQQMQDILYGHYGWDPMWGGSSYFGGYYAPYGSQFAPPPGDTTLAVPDEDGIKATDGGGDPHLRSAVEVTGYHIHASDGEIGHIEDVLIEDRSWDVRYLIADTSNWWAGHHVLLSPYAVKELDMFGRRANLALTCDKIRTSPPWQPAAMIDQVYEKNLHRHYGWPGYGW